METKVSVTRNYASMFTEVRVYRHSSAGGFDVLVGNGKNLWEWVNIGEGWEMPATLSLDENAVVQLRDALNKSTPPPTNDSDLRDALELERARVDLFLDKAMERMI